MPIPASESPVALEHLDAHLKAIIKVKLREFVHLSPCFEAIPSIDVSKYSQPAQHSIPMFNTSPDVVSHSPAARTHRPAIRRRALRVAVV